jgi:hypothetical protein
MDSRQDRYEEPKVVIAIPHNSPWAYRGPVKGPVESLSFIMGGIMMLNLGAFLLFVGGYLYYPEFREPFFAEVTRCIQKKPCFDKGYEKRDKVLSEKYRNLKQH